MIEIDFLPTVVAGALCREKRDQARGFQSDHFSYESTYTRTYVDLTLMMALPLAPTMTTRAESD